MIKDLITKFLLLFRDGHGLTVDKFTEDMWIFNGFGQKVLREDGQWVDFLPEYEIQKQRGVETMNCTVFNSLNCIEILEKAKYGQENNWSERFTGVFSDISVRGGSPHRSCEAIRKNGLIHDDLLPFDSLSWSQYYSPKPMTKELKEVGKEWLKAYKFNHEWVGTPGKEISREEMMKALKYSPLGVGVYAWAMEDNDMYYKPEGFRDNHWTCVVGYEKEKYWLIFDSYVPHIKKVAWDTKFYYVKRFSLDKLKEMENQCRA